MVSGVLQGLRFIWLWLAVGVGLIAVVVFLSLTPDPIDAGDIEGVKTGHFIAYLVLMLWFWQLLRPFSAKLAMAAALILLGVGLEFAQAETGYRTFALEDMLDNAFGVFAGFVLGLSALGRALRRLEDWIAGYTSDVPTRF